MSPSFPYLADVGIIALVPDAWRSNWLGRHQILTRLTQYFHVVWCAPALSWHQREWWRELLPGGGLQGEEETHGTVLPGLTIYHPERWLPQVGRPYFLACWTERQRLHRAQRILRTRGCHKIILYLCRPEYASALDLIDYDLSCYHIADEYTRSAIEQPTNAREAQLISRVDQMFIHSMAMLEKKGKLNPQTAFIPNGVDYHAFATPHSEPADLASIPHPRIGYVGRVKQRLNLALLIDLARRHQGWSFVLVGAQDGIGDHAALLQQFASMPNVYIIGSKSVSVLPAYTQHMDVCILCYEVNGYTKFIYPLKLHEYLASGRPVVGSPIRTLQDFAHIIRLARTTDEWSQAIQDSLSPDACSAEQVEVRRHVARQHDWNRLVALLAQTLCSRLGPTCLERFEERFGHILSYEYRALSALNDGQAVGP